MQFIYSESERTHFEKLSTFVDAAVEAVASSATEADHTLEWGAVHSEVKETVAKFLYDETRRRPMVLPVRVEV